MSWPVFAAGGSEEIAIGVAGRVEIIVLALFEVVVTGNIVFLAAFLMQADPSAAALHEIISDLDLNDGADAAEAVDYDGYEDAITQAEDIGLPAAAPIAGFS